MRILLGWMRKLLVFLLFVGAVGWFLPFVGWPFETRIEAPNSEPHGILLDSEGNIYCGSECYGRVQKYSAEGRFIRGYDTGGGIGRGSDFGFRIDEEGRLCITVSRIGEGNRGGIHRTTVYDDDGNVLRSEIERSGERDYSHPMRNSVFDSSGHRYVFKGFLFPRVVRTAASGERSILIGTPVWLWIFQAPFPAFGWLFLSMGAGVFLRMRQDASERSVPMTALLFRVERLPGGKRVGLFIAKIVGIAVVLSIAIVIGLETYPFLVVFGFLSFLAVLAAAVVLSGVVMIVCGRGRIKPGRQMLKKAFFGSVQERYEASRYLQGLGRNDPASRRMRRAGQRVVMGCLVVWVVVMAGAICVVVYLDHVGRLPGWVRR